MPVVRAKETLPKEEELGVEDIVPQEVDTELVKTEVFAEMVERKDKLVKIKFIENHTYNLGIVRFEKVVGDVLSVEPHLANKLISRKIAHVLG